MATNIRFYLSAAVVVVLFIETLFLGNTFSLQWHSPKLMYQVSAYLVPIKFLLICLALGALSGLILTGWRRYGRYLLLTLASLNLLLLSLVGVGYLFAGFAPLSQQFRLQGNIAVYTADPGAMGRAYHYFSYFCRNDYGFYRLEPISRLDWLGEFDFNEQQGELVITAVRHEPQEIRLPLTDFSCQ
ncbi:hypothetical protein [Alishewanella jeotgali]|uniref:Uncharacterized protein n=1 Tax=Alishewanella jeotgali KCTC 22429 TaxID=1129374 RepID=H3ZFZ1_9ALTE|nr:hypothetical protein [Alishewanella jeotgali]EHR40499.1 hypothetical protein AJE_11439 [Alishewanella jeotgali KCTC 22429]